MNTLSTATNPLLMMRATTHALTAQTEKRPTVSPSMHSAELLRGQKTVEIMHNGSTYRLQATRLGKLILTK